MARKPGKKLLTISITEDMVRTPQMGSVDQAQGLIKGVKILGLISENGRRYTRGALEKAKSLYEGRLVNVNHPSRPRDQRSAYDRIGKLQDVQLQDDGLYGDLILLRTHPLSKRVLEAAERMPEAFGLSHNADGQGYTDAEGIFIVETITEVRSVDLVADPATNKSLFEGKNVATKTKTLREALEGSKISAKLKKALLEMDEDLLDMEPEEDEDGDYKQHLVDAIGKLVSSADPADHEKAKKILAMFAPEKPTEEADGADEGKPVEEDDEDDEKKKKTEESRRHKAKGQALTEGKVKRLLKLAGVAEDKVLVETLQKFPDEDTALDHLDYLKGLMGGRRNPPRSSSPGQAGPITEGKAAKDGQTFASAILR